VRKILKGQRDRVDRIMKPITKGKCGFCSECFSGRAMVRHLVACRQRKKSIEAELSLVGKKFPENVVYLLKIYAGALLAVHRGGRVGHT
jgi:arginyl-tRNA--protein-N-Asp/Glu arginylyltransferase